MFCATQMILSYLPSNDLKASHFFLANSLPDTDALVRNVAVLDGLTETTGNRA